MITIFKDTKKRANRFAPYTAPDGTRYPRIPVELLEEVPDPAAPEDYSEDLYYRTEQDDAPYVIYTRKSDEQIAEIEAAKKVQAVTMRQARLALLGAGLLAPVNAALASAEGDAGEAARIEWEYAQEVRRDSPLVAGLADALGLTTEQLDELFETAAGL